MKNRTSNVPTWIQLKAAFSSAKKWLLGVGISMAPVVLGAADGAHLPVSLWSLLPFGILLLAIAICPLAIPQWWDPNGNKLKVSVPLGLAVSLYLGWNWGGVGLGLVAHELYALFQFLMLITTLFVISGGIYVAGDINAHVRENMMVLALGSFLASFIGTAGASMLLIRPLLRINSARIHVVHTIVFFIFIVSNTGGLLTPLGDPPLFLGFLRGVPFTWTLSLYKEWILVNGYLLFVYFIVENIYVKLEEGLERSETPVEFTVHGKVNFLFLGGVIALIAFSEPLGAFFNGLVGLVEKPGFIFSGGSPWRELLMGGLMVLAWRSTPAINREKNQFSFHPILEVAALFLGIFITMIPAIQFLQSHANDLGLNRVWHYFWVTGVLSSFLDNAPTYIVFLELAKSISFPPEMGPMVTLLEGQIPQRILEAISCGAVFMGANTYIGNGPNFMVKAVAESQGVKMPSFFGFMVWSVCILLPLFGFVTLFFFL